MRYIVQWCLNTGCCMCAWRSLLLMINVTEASKLKRSLNFLSSLSVFAWFFFFSILYPGIMKLEDANYWQFWASGWSLWYYGVPGMWKGIISQSLGPVRAEGFPFPLWAAPLPSRYVSKTSAWFGLVQIQGRETSQTAIKLLGFNPLALCLEVTRASRTTRVTSESLLIK